MCKKDEATSGKCGAWGWRGRPHTMIERVYDGEAKPPELRKTAAALWCHMLNPSLEMLRLVVKALKLSVLKLKWAALAWLAD